MIRELNDFEQSESIDFNLDLKSKIILKKKKYFMNKLALLNIVNQIFDIEKKVNDLEHHEKFKRNFSRISFELEAGFNLVVKIPTGEKYSDGRMDCDANIVGEMKPGMIISDTLKPVIYEKNEDGSLKIIQKAVVIVSSK